MYQPLPPRPKKTNIVRVRTGCQTCRRRKLKVREVAQFLLGCAELNLPHSAMKESLNVELAYAVVFIVRAMLNVLHFVMIRTPLCTE